MLVIHYFLLCSMDALHRSLHSFTAAWSGHTACLGSRPLPLYHNYGHLFSQVPYVDSFAMGYRIPFASSLAAGWLFIPTVIPHLPVIPSGLHTYACSLTIIHTLGSHGLFVRQFSRASRYKKTRNDYESYGTAPGHAPRH